MLDRAGIAARIPHQGSMCLLDAVLDWSPTTIACRAVSHADPANPLRAEGRLVHGGRQVATAEGRLIGADGRLYAHASTTCLVFDLAP